MNNLGRDILEDIALRLEDGRDRLRFSGGVSKEIKRMLWEEGGEMPIGLYKAVTWVVKNSKGRDICTQLPCSGSRGGDVVYGRLLMSKKIIVVDDEEDDEDCCRGEEEEEERGANGETTLTTTTTTTTSNHHHHHSNNNDSGIELEFRGIDICGNKGRQQIQKQMEHIMSVLLSLPVHGMTFDRVHFGSEYKAMVDVLRHGAFKKLKSLQIKNVSVVLSERDSLCHLEALEDVLIQDCFVSLQGDLMHLLPSNLKRIGVISSTCSVSVSYTHLRAHET